MARRAKRTTRTEEKRNEVLHDTEAPHVMQDLRSSESREWEGLDIPMKEWEGMKCHRRREFGKYDL